MIYLIIPALNEEASVGLVIEALPKDLSIHTIVVDNGSTDATNNVAKTAGATVLLEARRGYGYACLAGIEHIKNIAKPNDIVAFMDADFSDYPNELPEIIAPITKEKVDMVIGSRVLGMAEAGSLQPVQRFGNWLSTNLIKIIFKQAYTDLGPFRAIRHDSLLQLNMEDKTYGWTVEMQVKAAQHKLKTVEVPVNYRVRIGQSKVSGTIKGSIKAGYKILFTIFYLWLKGINK